MGATSLPKIYAQLLAANAIVGVDPFRILICGQTGTDGTATTLTAIEEVQNKTRAEIKALTGTKSELTMRINRVLDIVKGRVSVWVMPVAPAVGTAATRTITVSGAATEDKTLTAKIIDSQYYSISVDVVSGEAAAAVATKIKAAIDALTDLPATAGIISAAITLTANDLGTIANKFTVKFDNLPAGISITEGQFSSGATDPTLTTMFDSLIATRFHSVLFPWSSSSATVKTFLESRNTISNAFLQGVAMIGFDDTEANITSLVNGTTPLNSPNLLFIGNRKVSSASVIVTPPDNRAAEFAAIEALRLTTDAPISSYVTVSSPRDQWGGSALASLGLYNTPLAYTSLTAPSSLFSFNEQENLKNDGFTITGVNESKTSMIMGEVVTTYKFNSKGDPDVSFKYLEYIRTGYLALELFYKRLKSDYSQFRLTEGDLISGRAIANAGSIRANCISIFKTLGEKDYVLCQSGGDAEKYFNENLVIETDLANGKVSISGMLPIITQIRQFNLTFQLSFTIGG